ncbi:class I SAM-dependent methyltransferase [Chitinophaga lutea]
MRYVLYFFYMAWHWSPRLAWFVIRREVVGERKYGLHTLGTYQLKDVLTYDRHYATMYEPVNYYSAERLFGYLTPDDLQTGYLDAGCGKGRTLAIALHKGFTNVTGIDFSPSLCRDAQQVKGAKIVCINARDYSIPDDTGVIFLFNPFEGNMMQAFIGNVRASLARRSRRIRVLYANPQCRHLWLDAGFRETHSFEHLQFLKGCVLEWSVGTGPDGGAA